MKRLLSITMASVLMVLTLSAGLTAMAETASGTSNYNSKNFSPSYYYTTSSTPFTANYNIVFEWDNLDFVYTKNSVTTWDSGNFRLKTEESGSKWNKTSATIKVTNNSNVGFYSSMTASSMPSCLSAKIDKDKLNPSETATVTITASGVPTNSSKQTCTVGIVAKAYDYSSGGGKTDATEPV